MVGALCFVGQTLKLPDSGVLSLGACVEKLALMVSGFVWREGRLLPPIYPAFIKLFPVLKRRAAVFQWISNCYGQTPFPPSPGEDPVGDEFGLPSPPCFAAGVAETSPREEDFFTLSPEPAQMELFLPPPSAPQGGWEWTVLPQPTSQTLPRSEIWAVPVSEASPPLPAPFLRAIPSPPLQAVPPMASQASPPLPAPASEKAEEALPVVALLLSDDDVSPASGSVEELSPLPLPSALPPPQAETVPVQDGVGDGPEPTGTSGQPVAVPTLSVIPSPVPASPPLLPLAAPAALPLLEALSSVSASETALEPAACSTLDHPGLAARPRSRFPSGATFIINSDFFERFSFFVTAGVLIIYCINFLRWDVRVTAAIYHTFVALCFLTPILGAIIADSWLGKFKTILYLSIVYIIGQAVLTVSSINDLTDHNQDGSPDNVAVHIALSMVGLILIALGTGGIKPCVSAFGADQFEDDQENQRSTFFSYFYENTAVASFISAIVIPQLMASECGIHSKQECYPLAFGVPAALVAVALVVFVIGSRMYKKAKPQGNVMLEVSKCVGFAIKNRFRHRSKEFPKREHWLDWASDKYDKRLIAQIKMVLRVLFLYIPLPMFWALFYQQGSRWTLQATAMNGDFGFQIQPEQMQIVKPILIVIIIPVADYLVYPLIKKCKLNFTPLKKMTVGMFLGSMAFVAAALVQVQIDKTYQVSPAAGQTQIKLINLGAVPATVQFQPQLQSVEVAPNEATGYMTFETSKLQSLDIISATLNKTEHLELLERQRYTLAFKQRPTDISSTCVEDNVTSKPANRESLVRFINNLPLTANVVMDNIRFGKLYPLSVSNYSILPNPSWPYIISASTALTYCVVSSKILEYGVAYTISLDDCFASILKVTYFEDILPSKVHMAWQIPQYFLLACAEVLFSVTGLEFSYSQAPSNMKSVLQAGWLLTVAVGNIIVLIVAGVSAIQQQWAEYVLFAALLLVVCIIFAIMASFYTYIDPNEIEAQFSKEEKEEDKKDQDTNEKEAEAHSQL
ncbi:solute carrier family 15 member 1-like [Passerculus sandwichensis]